ncbi:H-NS family nucleoid-associated regulatory protein [Paraburkholderia sp. BCC1884]|uniref:H-NS family nucleoid-associated regulatory protein n=1 Tax=Paraburkholderia sp. BCC1884 TaxID=2562668 RepID=UPI001181DE0B|nr:H-NS family nucleoid-associated regulatory protein [Paraburkholderia sp. BCC1884]
MATLEQIQAKLKKLQAQAEVMLAKKSQTAIDKIRELMLEHGLTTADIEAKAKVAREGKTLRGAASKIGKVTSSVQAKGTPKYQHPKTGATWSGHGRAPAWISEAKDRTKFLIGGTVNSGAVNERRPAEKTTARSVSGKGQPKGPQPAMYRDPKSGATWSGRGRAPAWLGANRGKFLIEGAADEVKVTSTGTTAKPKTVRATKAMVEKSVAKKIVAKKAALKKVANAKKSTVVKVSAKKSAATPLAKGRAVKKSPGRPAAVNKAVATTETVPAVPEIAAAEVTG